MDYECRNCGHVHHSFSSKTISMGAIVGYYLPSILFALGLPLFLIQFLGIDSKLAVGIFLFCALLSAALILGIHKKFCKGFHISQLELVFLFILGPLAYPFLLALLIEFCYVFLSHCRKCGARNWIIKEEHNSGFGL